MFWPFGGDETDEQKQERRDEEMRQARMRNAREAKRNNYWLRPSYQHVDPTAGLATPQDQTRILQGAANAAMAAHSKEMDGRRASFREARRLQHEKDMLLLRLQAERDARLGR